MTGRMAGPLELRDFAERLLHGPALADKLFDPGPLPLADARRGPALRGRVDPGRAPALAIHPRAEPFAKDAALADAGARGRALHFFANHELLAIELMALALLRFPDAPPAFRRGLAATIRDEQRHLGLYLERMAELGTQLGDAPLGGFFWRTVAELDSPAAFVAHMSLTFEQANLDHAAHYAALFEGLGDGRSAALMATIYADEIRHVGFGLRWFERWVEDPERELIARHRDALVAPVSLRRAKGRGFDAEGRRRAGLSQAYVAAMANLPHHRGRRPVVHLFDPNAEHELSQGPRGGHTAPPQVLARTRDLEALALFYAAPDDVVLVRRRPSEAFLTALREAGVALPELVEVPELDGDAGALAARFERGASRPPLDAIERIQPWAWSPRMRARLQALRSQARLDTAPSDDASRELLSKALGVGLLEAVLREFAGDEATARRLSPLDSVGRVARSLDEVLDAIARFRALGYAVVACKAKHGTAGRGIRRILPGGPEPAELGWLRNTLARQGLIVVEPWLDRVADLSLRLLIPAPGQARIEGVGRVLVDARGQYLGAVLGRPTTGLDSSLARFLHGDGDDPRWLEAVWRRTAERLAERLAPSGYVGPVGVDAILHRDPRGQLRLRPAVEVNARVHMGHVAVHLQRLLARGAVGLWRIVPKARLPASLPAVELAHGPGGKLGIRAGVLPTNDPDQAEVVVGLLAVAGTLDDAAALLARD